LTKKKNKIMLEDETKKKTSKLDEPLKLMSISQTYRSLHFILKLDRKVQHPTNLSLNDKIN
jgi:pantothenate kinase